MTTLTFKTQSLYCAYAPDAGVCSYGACFEEAVNSLSDELRSHARLKDHYREHEGPRRCRLCGETLHGPYHRCS